jgi:hypothetical protein
MAGISRVNGYAQAGGFYGYTPAFYLVTGTNVGTANSPATPDGTAITEGNFDKAIRAIERISSIVFVGPRSNNGFLVGIDAPTANAYVSANTDTDVAAAIDAVVTAATSVSTTVAAKTLTLADFA